VTSCRLPRRILLQAALLGGCADLGPPPLPPPAAEDDPAILNNLLALEHAAGTAYEGTLHLLGKARRENATRFRAEHGQHAAALIVAVRRHGGDPVAPAPFHGVVEDETAALRLLADEERGLASAYIGALPAFADRDLARTVGNILAVEMLHWAAWRQALGLPPSDGPFFFDQKAAT
jgi:hypothetical protein